MAKSDPRKTFGKVMLELVEKNENILSVSCDSCSGSGLSDLKAQYPDKIVEVGISEQNAVGICAGLSLCGYKPVISVINPFLTMRAYEQIRDDIGYAKSNVLIMGMNCGVAYSTLGSTHAAIEDMAVMRSVPNLIVMSPGDGYEVEMAVKSAIAHKGPVYIRMPRQALDDILPKEERNFEIGKSEVVCGNLSEGKNAVIIATGTMVNRAKKACSILSEKGINTAVIDMCTIKPLDTKAIDSAAKVTKNIFTIEEHCVYGGLGTAVAQHLSKTASGAKLEVMGIKEGEKATGPYEELIDYMGLSESKIAANIESKIKIR